MPKRQRKSATDHGVSSHWQVNSELLYDFVYEEKLDCPSYASNYLKDKHIWQGLPHALLVCDVNLGEYEVEKVQVTKRLIHPGPILRIKASQFYPHLIATHTQHKYVFLWNTATQHDRVLNNNSDPNTPELILKGHRKDAVHALDFCRTDLSVASGGKDQTVCCWNIGDYQTTCADRREPGKNEQFVPLSKPSPKLKPRFILQGHCGEVTDVEFHPKSSTTLCSVSTDKSLKMWDLRMSPTSRMVQDVVKLHSEGMTHLSWNGYADTMIVTAALDGNIKLLDIRNPGKHLESMHTFRGPTGHSARISSLEWNPSPLYSHLFMSSSHDGSVVIWDQHKGAIFKHIGHLNPVKGDLFGVIHSASWLETQDNASWTICSTSSTKPFVPFFWSSSSEKCSMDVDGSNGKGMEHIQRGGLMQIWRPSVMLRKSKEDVLKHLIRWKGKKFVDDLHGK